MHKSAALKGQPHWHKLRMFSAADKSILPSFKLSSLFRTSHYLFYPLNQWLTLQLWSSSPDKQLGSVVKSVSPDCFFLFGFSLPGNAECCALIRWWELVRSKHGQRMQTSVLRDLQRSGNSPCFLPASHGSSLVVDFIQKEFLPSRHLDSLKPQTAAHLVTSVKAQKSCLVIILNTDNHLHLISHFWCARLIWVTIKPWWRVPCTFQLGDFMPESSVVTVTAELLGTRMATCSVWPPHSTYKVVSHFTKAQNKHTCMWVCDWACMSCSLRRTVSDSNNSCMSYCRMVAFSPAQVHSLLSLWWHEFCNGLGSLLE